jgi:hypothetical protein
MGRAVTVDRYDKMVLQFRERPEILHRHLGV